MMRLAKLVATMWVTLTFCCVGNVFAQSGELDSMETETLVYLREFAKFKWDIFHTSARVTEEDDPVRHPMYASLAADALVHLDKLKLLIDHYGIEDPVPTPYEVTWIWGYNDDFITDLANDYLNFVVWEQHTEEEILDLIAYFVEMNIFDLRQAILETDEQLLIDTYADVLAGAYPQLLTLVAVYHSNPFDYEAQLLSQVEVDEIIAAALGENFKINPGLNDAWYQPDTNGQGFFLAVYPEKGTVSLGWFTFDIDLPGQNAIASLGDACQRWLIATGPYDGSQAELVVYNSSGGLFNSTSTEPQLEPIGSITLKFENCSFGTVNYDLPKYGVEGEIPIQRVGSDNVASCELGNYLVH